MASLSLVFSFALILLSSQGIANSPTLTRPVFRQDPVWAQFLNSKIQNLDQATNGTLGVYIKDVSSGEIFSYNAHRDWYLASAVKVPVAIEVYRQVAAGLIDDKKPIVISEIDYRDGAGKTNWLKPGEKVTLRYLVEQMLIESDNTATDMLINQVGIENINQNLQALVLWGFSPITSLLDVRKGIYSEFHDKATKLTNQDFMTLKNIKLEKEKLARLSQLLVVEEKEFQVKTLHEAFSRYYIKNFNSATLVAYTKMLESILENKTPEPKDWPRLIDIMLKCNTGKNRIVSGLSRDILFAHKTGTQHQRICDMGFAFKKNSDKKVIISTCIEEFNDLTNAENTLKRVGSLIKKSKVLN